MLARLETFYLGILRVVILVVATIALLSAALLLARAAPTIVQQLGFAPNPAVVGGSLGEFISEKKATSSTDASPATEPGQPASDGAVDPTIISVAQTINAYVHDQRTTAADWERALVQSLSRVPPEYHTDYIASLDRLTKQLKASKGKPLSLQQVAELLEWHERHFIANAASVEADRVAESGKTAFYLYAMASAFMTFLLITFAFLFVKIERSLRVVRTQSVGGMDD